MSCLSANSQIFTLNDCINYAYAHRVELQKQEAAQNYYNKNYTYSKYSFLPSLSSQANFQFNDGTQNKLTQSGTVELASELILFNGFQTFNALKQSKLLSDRNKTYTEKICNDIRLEISEIYFSLLLAQENSGILQNSRRVLI
jgi:outer membrane protein